MKQEKEYFAFISYKREDEKWAKWLATQLDNYKLPSTLNGKELPQSLRKTFRDVDELSAGNLPEQIYNALSKSDNLIVICSPRSAKSEWVNKEIEDFITIKGGNSDHIFPFIIEGKPFAKEVDQECFPMALRMLSDQEERLGGNINEQGGRDAAVVKIVAGMLEVPFDSLWRKHEREERKRRNMLIIIGIFAFLIVSCIAVWMYMQKQETLKANWLMKEKLSMAVSEKALSLIGEGNSYLASLLALEILPCDSFPNRPYTAEAEKLLRESLVEETAMLKTNEYGIVGFSSDCKRFILGPYIWDLKSGSRILKIKTDPDYEIIQKWHPNDSFFVSTKKDTILLRNSYSGKCVRSFLGHVGDVLCVAFSPKGDILFSGGNDNMIKIWNTFSGKCIDTKKYHMDGVIYFDLIKNGEELITISNDSTMLIRNAKSFQLVKNINIHIAPSSNCITFSPSEDVVALTKEYSSHVYFWDINREILKDELETNTSIHSIQYSGDGRSIIVGSNKGVDMFDIRSHERHRLCETSSSVISLSLSSDGRHLLAKTLFDDNLRLLDLKQKVDHYQLQYTDTINIHGLFFTPNKHLVGATGNNGILYLWNLCSGKLEKEYNLKRSIYGGYSHSAQIHPQENKAVFLSHKKIGKVINIESGKIALNLEGKVDSSMFLKYSGDGNYVIGSEFMWRRTKIWDSMTGKLKCDLVSSIDTVYTDILVPNKGFLVSIIDGSKINLVNISNNKNVIYLTGKSKNIMYVKSSRNGNYIASLSSDSTICIWDIAKRKCLHTMRNVECDRNLIVFSDDELKIASQGIDKSILIWDVKTGALINKLIGHKKDLYRVDGICFSSNGQYLVSSSKDKTIRLWEIFSGGCLKVLHQSRDMNSAFFGPDKACILYQGENGWKVDNYLSVPLNELINSTRKRFANRKLSDEERLQFHLN